MRLVTRFRSTRAILILWFDRNRSIIGVLKMSTESHNTDAGRHTFALIGWIVLAAALTACGASEERVFDEIESPDGAYRLRITVAEPRMPHGRFQIGVYLLKRGDDSGHKLIDEKLENDGVPFTAQNLPVRWTGLHAALVCLRATDLPDRGFRIDIAGTPEVREIDQC